MENTTFDWYLKQKIRVRRRNYVFSVNTVNFLCSTYVTDEEVRNNSYESNKSFRLLYRTRDREKFRESRFFIVYNRKKNMRQVSLFDICLSSTLQFVLLVRPLENLHYSSRRTCFL